MLAIVNSTLVLLFSLFYVVVVALFVKVIIVGFIFVSGSIVFFGSTNPLGWKVYTLLLVRGRRMQWCTGVRNRKFRQEYAT